MPGELAATTASSGALAAPSTARAPVRGSSCRSRRAGRARIEALDGLDAPPTPIACPRDRSRAAVRATAARASVANVGCSRTEVVRRRSAPALTANCRCGRSCRPAADLAREVDDEVVAERHRLSSTRSPGEKLRDVRSAVLPARAIDSTRTSRSVGVAVSSAIGNSNTARGARRRRTPRARARPPRPGRESHHGSPPGPTTVTPRGASFARRGRAADDRGREPRRAGRPHPARAVPLLARRRRSGRAAPRRAARARPATARDGTVRRSRSRPSSPSRRSVASRPRTSAITSPSRRRSAPARAPPPRAAARGAPAPRAPRRGSIASIRAPHGAARCTPRSPSAAASTGTRVPPAPASM